MVRAVMSENTAKRRQADRPANATGRRAQLLALAAQLFADRGFVSTTVRDIADAAGILSGSLYHHFDSKESMADELLTGFLDELFDTYARIMDSERGPRQRLEAVVITSFESIHQHPAEVAIYQNEAKHLAGFPRFSYLNDRGADFRKLWTGILADGVRDGVFRADLDIEMVYRFIRDTVWVAVRWYNPDGALSAEAVARQYLGILLDGIAAHRQGEK